MVERRGVFVLIRKPPWLGVGDLARLLPRCGAVAHAAFRCPVLLAPDDLASDLCRQVRCYPPGLADAVREAVMGWWGRGEEVGDLVRRIDEVVRRFETVECVGVEALGCYLSSAPPDIPGCGDLTGWPVIVVNVDKVSRVVDESLGDVGVRAARPSEVRKRLLRSVIAHEVTHSYADMASPESPKRGLNRLWTRFYHDVIEESLATHYQLLEALSTRGSTPTRTLTHYVTHKLLQESTIEYRAGLVWYLRRGEHLTPTPDEVLNAWVGLSNATPLMMTYLHEHLEPALNEILNHPIAPHILRRYITALWLRHWPLIKHRDTLWKLLATSLILQTPKPPYVARIR